MAKNSVDLNRLKSLKIGNRDQKAEQEALEIHGSVEEQSQEPVESQLAPSIVEESIGLKTQAGLPVQEAEPVRPLYREIETSKSTATPKKPDPALPERQKEELKSTYRDVNSQHFSEKNITFATLECPYCEKKFSAKDMVFIDSNYKEGVENDLYIETYKEACKGFTHYRAVATGLLASNQASDDNHNSLDLIKKGEFYYLDDERVLNINWVQDREKRNIPKTLQLRLKNADGVDRTVRRSTKVCPHCLFLLPENLGESTNHKILLVGQSGAGKTTYLVQLQNEIHGFPFRFLEESKEYFRPIVEYFKNNDHRVYHTRPDIDSRIMPLLMNVQGDEKSFYSLYDIAGEATIKDALADVADYSINRDMETIFCIIEPSQLDMTRFGTTRTEEGELVTIEGVTNFQNYYYNVLGKYKDDLKGKVKTIIFIINKVDIILERDYKNPRVKALKDSKFPQRYGREKVKAPNGMIEDKILSDVENKQASDHLSSLFMSLVQSYTGFQLKKTVIQDFGEIDIKVFGVSSYQCSYNHSKEKWEILQGIVRGHRLEEPIMYLINKFKAQDSLTKEMLKAEPVKRKKFLGIF